MISFKKTYVGKIRGGIFYTKVFSFDEKIKVALDGHLIDLIEKLFGMIDKIDQDEDDITIKTIEENYSFLISDERLIFNARPMTVEYIGNFISSLKEFLSAFETQMSIKNKIKTVGIEFTYVIPFNKEVALQLFYNNVLHSGRNLFYTDAVLKSEQAGFQSSFLKDCINHEIIIKTGKGNDAILVSADMRCNLFEEKSMSYQSLLDNALSILENVIFPVTIEPFLSNEELDQELLLKGKK